MVYRPTIDSHVSPQSLTAEQTGERMRNVFQAGLSIHLQGEEMEACRAVATQLFPHQRVGLAWMVRHENRESGGMRGGILADDMVSHQPVFAQVYNGCRAWERL